MKEKIQKASLMGPISLDKSQVSLLDLAANHIQVSPLVCLDFSMANITFSSQGTSVHTPNLTKPNQYRSLLEMVSQQMFSGELYLPIFGYGAKTFKSSGVTADLFPMSMKLGNPLVPNKVEIINEAYNSCLGKIKMDVPVKLAPMLNFLKNLALGVRE